MFRSEDRIKRGQNKVVKKKCKVSACPACPRDTPLETFETDPRLHDQRPERRISGPRAKDGSS